MSAELERHISEASAWLERDRLDRAAEAIARGLALDPNSVELRYLGALLEYERDDFSAAASANDAVLRDAPAHYAARVLAARVARAQTDLARAETIQLELLSDYPADENLLAEYALTVLHGGQFEKASQLSAEALRVNPSCQLALVVLGYIDILREKPVNQQHALQTLLQQNPSARHALNLLAHAQLGAHRPQDAREVAAQLVREQPNDPATLSLARAARLQSHWSMLPLWPLMRYGWGASIALYVLGVVVIRGSREMLSPNWHFALVMLWVSYIIYSWIWPPLLKRWLERGEKS